MGFVCATAFAVDDDIRGYQANHSASIDTIESFMRVFESAVYTCRSSIICGSASWNCPFRMLTVGYMCGWMTGNAVDEDTEDVLRNVADINRLTCVSPWDS